jgi:hypothetical protein
MRRFDIISLAAWVMVAMALMPASATSELAQDGTTCVIEKLVPVRHPCSTKAWYYAESNDDV